MPTMILTNRQVVELVKQLAPKDKRDALFVLAEAASVPIFIKHLDLIDRE
jgi:hypothetical protein